MSTLSTGLSAEERRAGAPDRVRTIRETAEILGIGEFSLRNLIWKGEGPQVTRLSARRIGVRDCHREAWLNARAQSQPA